MLPRISCPLNQALTFVEIFSAIASTRDGSRTLVYSVNSTDAKGSSMNKVAMNVMVAAYGMPS